MYKPSLRSEAFENVPLLLRRLRCLTSLSVDGATLGFNATSNLFTAYCTNCDINDRQMATPPIAWDEAVILKYNLH